MSIHVLPEQVCYVNCSFCNTVLVVNIPGNNSFSIVTVRCGLCANILYVNLEALHGVLPLQNFQNKVQMDFGSQRLHMDFGSSSSCTRLSVMNPVDYVQQQMQLIHPTEKRRAPSAYNRFIKEEIRRLKAKNPNISHKEAFSTAAKNWAHFPEIHLGLSIKGNKQV
ncbi:YABBY protein [Musa troglodytarum]|uniref:YABBY protein n=1 Tax=Musa troglodytarum TaxID=320322 RepID=A0A9E7HWE2_9LILI|nr:YABBY protein [Musa troglodytarum]